MELILGSTHTTYVSHNIITTCTLYACYVTNAHTHSHVYTAQATSYDDRKEWVEKVEGREPIFACLRLKILEGKF